MFFQISLLSCNIRVTFLIEFPLVPVVVDGPNCIFVSTENPTLTEFHCMRSSVVKNYLFPQFAVIEIRTKKTRDISDAIFPACNNISTLFPGLRFPRRPRCLQTKRSNWRTRVANKMFHARARTSRSLSYPPTPALTHSFHFFSFLLVLFFHGITKINQAMARATGLTNKFNETRAFA